MYSELLKQTSPHEKSIARDLNRTFPKHEYFKDAEGSGQENLCVRGSSVGVPLLLSFLPPSLAESSRADAP